MKTSSTNRDEQSELTTAGTTRTPLLWTIGFSGKRMLTREQENNVRAGLRRTLDFLKDAAAEQASKLTGVSSVARGGDVLFAQACLLLDEGQSHAKSEVIPWKGLLPFEQEDFFRLDLKDAESEEKSARRAVAEHCLKQSYLGEGLNVNESGNVNFADINEADAARQRELEAELEKQLDEAYAWCGYRTVDESDVMVFVVTQAEWDNLVEAEKTWELEKAAWTQKSEGVQSEWESWSRKLGRNKKNMKQEQPPDLPPMTPVMRPNITTHRAGTIAMVRYALASKRPCLFVNANDGGTEVKPKLVIPNAGRELFVDPVITPLIKALVTKHGELPKDATGTSTVKELLGWLDKEAMHFQTRTQGGLSKTLRWHLLASSIAAVFATVLHMNQQQWNTLHDWRVAGQALLWLLACLAAVKPLFAFMAMRMEKHLHHEGARDNWVHHRILAEVCRGALGRWDLPKQPLDALDEEDFPKVKRLIRSLRLLRDLAEPTMRANAEPPREIRPGETLTEAKFREACGVYIEIRLKDQAAHYGKKRWEALRDERWWLVCFHVSLWTAIGCGLILLGYKLKHVLGPHEVSGEHYWELFQPMAWVAAIAIIAPFFATYALGNITISDCRRRASRYDEMHHYLLRLAGTLESCEAMPSRLRLIEQAERMMIEEQHEWFSVTRNYSV